MNYTKTKSFRKKDVEKGTSGSALSKLCNARLSLKNNFGVPTDSSLSDQII
jgi:hypothetical protein